MSAVIEDASQILHHPNLMPAVISAIDQDTTGCPGQSPPIVPVFPSALLATPIKTARCCVLPLVPDALEYIDSDVPEPPSVGLEIELLTAIWDDSWPTWRNKSPLVIKGRPVALKHFRSVYIGSSQWASVRQQWSKWNVSGLHSIVSYLFDKTSFGQKFLMKEYISSGAHKFWERWSVDGKRSTPSQILAGLAKKRKDAEKADADAARKEYVTNDDFEEVFSYRKGAQKFNMVSEKAIARRFRQLNKHPY